MPALAGSSRVPYGTFMRFNTPAVVLGIGQFILLGYLCGHHVGRVLALLQRGGWMLLLAALFIAVLIWIVRRHMGARALSVNPDAR